MPELAYDMKPAGKVLEEFADCRARNSFIMGPLGSGKTVQTILKFLELMCEQEPVRRKDHPNYGVRPSRIIAARNTYSELFSTTIKDWMEIHGDLGVFREGNKHPPTHSIKFNLPDGTKVESEIIFIAFDRPEHVKKARGIQCTWAWLNETKELPKAVVDMLDLRCGRYPSLKEGVKATHHGLIGDTNAPDNDHWYYKLAEEVKPEGWTFHRQPGGVKKVDGQWTTNHKAENIQNLPNGYYERGLSGKSEDWISVNLANEYGFISDGKPVHPFYKDHVHALTEHYTPDRNVPIVLGYDFGRTPACAFLQCDTMGRWIAFDEYVTEDQGAVDFGRGLKSYLDATYPGYGFVGYGDPAGQQKTQVSDQTPFKALRAAGLPAVPCSSNDIILRRAAVELPLKEMLIDGKPRLMVAPRAQTLRKGLAGGFCYKRVSVAGDERYRDEPDKNKFSHVVEAAEYALLGSGEGRQVIKSKGNFQKPAAVNWDFSPFD